MERMSKLMLQHNSQHTQLRIPQGIPVRVAVLPNEASSATDVMQFSTDRIAHVSPAGGAKNHVHVYATSEEDADVYVEVLSSVSIAESGSGASRATVWPDQSASMRIRVRANQTAPQLLLQGYTVSAGAAVSLYAGVEGVKFYGFALED